GERVLHVCPCQNVAQRRVELALANSCFLDRPLQHRLDRFWFPRHVLQDVDRGADTLRGGGVERGWSRVGPQIVEIVDRLRELVHSSLERRNRALDGRRIEVRNKGLQAARQLLVREL